MHCYPNTTKISTSRNRNALRLGDTIRAHVSKTTFPTHDNCKIVSSRCMCLTKVQSEASPPNGKRQMVPYAADAVRFSAICNFSRETENPPRVSDGLDIGNSPQRKMPRNGSRKAKNVRAKHPRGSQPHSLSRSPAPTSGRRPRSVSILHYKRRQKKKKTTTRMTMHAN